MTQIHEADLTSTLVSPFPVAWAPQLYGWLREDWDANVSDEGPQTLEDVQADLMQRDGVEQTWGVMTDAPVGFLGYAPVNHDTGMLHGVCFAKAVHGTGLAARSLTAVLVELARQNVRKVSASYFADNQRVRRFLQRQGFVDEGFLVNQTRRHGVLTSMYLVARMLGD
jgi:RimJ/RimL family protein N-acetyltransferase